MALNSPVPIALAFKIAAKTQCLTWKMPLTTEFGQFDWNLRLRTSSIAAGK
jgi:hypothetical protein